MKKICTKSSSTQNHRMYVRGYSIFYPYMRVDLKFQALAERKDIHLVLCEFYKQSES